jgi:hypothetical protein
MQDKHLYEYAVIRVVPRVEREEFLNVGVVLYCARPKFLGVSFALDGKRLAAFTCEPDLLQLSEYLLAFERICKGYPDAGPIAALTPAERFRWLTATRSTVLQTSRVHPGFCASPEETLGRLFGELVL